MWTVPEDRITSFLALTVNRLLRSSRDAYSIPDATVDLPLKRTLKALCQVMTW